MNKKVTVTGVNVLFFIFAVVLLFSQIALVFINELLDLKLFDKNIYVMLLINQFILILIPVLLYTFIFRLDFKEVFRFNRLKLLPGLLIVLLAVPAYFVAAMLNSFVLYLLQFIGQIPDSPIPVPGNIPELVVGILIIGVSPAICEELLHRGLLLKAYEKRGSIKAVVITSIFFGVFHMDITNLLGPIFLGLLIGYYVIRTNSIFAGMLAHFLNNTIAECLSYLTRNWEDTSQTTISLSDLGTITMLGVAGLIIVLILIRWFTFLSENIGEIRPPISSVRKDITAILSHWPNIATLALYVVITLLTVLVMVIGKFSGG